VAEPSQAPWPQEIRIAMTMTGGSSLAVWMGGIASETSALLTASRSTDPGPYRKLLDLLNATVSVDVLTGTSAGGVNAACLGLAEAYQSSPEILREVWITAGSLDNLIRDPSERAPRSLLDGDRVLLAGLTDAFGKMVETREDPPANPDITVLLTGTMIDGETVRYDDALGNLVRDSEHRLLFRFDGPLWTKDAIGPLALAARSTASFPGVFELSHLPVHETGADALHPDLAPYTEVARSHWLTDGGVLLNKPLHPALREIFERWSQKDVRRLLLYVVPTDAGEAGRVVPDPADPPLLVDALRHVVSAVMNQSISTELEDLTAHNDAVGRTHDTRVSLAGLAARNGQGLITQRLMDDYRDRRVQEDATAIVREATRRLDRDDAAAGEQWASGMSRNLREAAVKRLRDSLPGEPPGDECPLETVTLFRTTALDDAVATGLQLVNAGFRLAPAEDQVAALNDGRVKLHDALRMATRAERLTGWVAKEPAPNPGVELSVWVGSLAARWAKMGQTAKLAEAWPMVASALRELGPVLRALATAQETALPAGLEGGRADAVAAITTLLDWLGLPGGKTDPALYARLLTLHVATRGLVTQPPSVDQRVDLVQVSADSRTLLDMKRGRATEKLTGMQADYFGAFYKASWRASDWMWGRIDGAGWLMQCLLDPHRLAYISAAGIKETFEAIGWQPPRQQDGLSEAEITALRGQLTEELGFLGLDADLKPVERTANLPSSLPVTAMVLARSRQVELAASELPNVAKYAKSDAATEHGNGKPSSAFCDLMDNPPKDPEATQNAFKACQISAETLDGERGSMLLTKTLVKAGAAGINAVAVAMPMPKSVQPAATFAQAAGRAAWWITEGAAKLGKPWNLLAALITVLAGIVVGGQADTVLQWIGLPVAVGALLFLLVAIFTARRTWRRLFGLVWVAVAACLLFAAYIPPIREHLFAWLATLMTGWKQGEAPLWWLVVAAFLILPAVTTPLAAVGRLITRKTAKRK
jgi:patatin-related protein